MDPKAQNAFQHLEESLWRADTRFDDALMEATFAPDFFEYGRSGRRYTRAEMFFGDSDHTQINATLPLQNFVARHLSDDVVLITYQSEVRYSDVIERANRSSIWSKHAEGWKIRFHQGTPTLD